MGVRYHAALARSGCIDDLRGIARARLPRAVFDFIDGAAEAEITRRANLDDLAALRFLPRYLQDVAKREPGVDILSRPSALPLIVAPTGLAALAWPQADILIARAAGKAGIPFVISTSSSVRLEDIAAACPGGRLWFQIYIYKDRALVRSLIDRAKAAGVEAIVCTVDTPMLGWRRRDHRNGFTVPLKPTFALAADVIRCAGWSWGIARHGVPRMQNFVEAGGASDIVSLSQLMTNNMDASLTWSDIDWLRHVWTGPLIIKGLLASEDVARAVQLGIDAVWISNHGGRQLDGAASTISALPAAVAEAKGVEIFMDGGVRTGGDIAKVLALGGRAAAIGRPILYGVAAGGQAGAERALEFLISEYDRCLALLGSRRSLDLERSHLSSPLHHSVAGTYLR